MANLKCQHCAERNESCDTVILCRSCLDKLSENEWISVEDKSRSPEDMEDCLLINTDGDIAVGWFEDGHFWCWDDRYETHRSTTHWMPLPEPPKEAE